MTTIKILLFSFLFSLSLYSQDTTKIKREYLMTGIFSATASILPYHVAKETYVYNKENTYSYIFTGVWFSFGLALDINATYNFIQYHKLKKKSVSL
jgi:hypothetical protein